MFFEVFEIDDDSASILVNDMCVDINDLKAKIESPDVIQCSTKISEVINTLCGFIGKKSAEEFNNYCLSIICEIEGEPYFVLDSLRMVFYRFASGGLEELFVYQENEAWYPKIILTTVLHPNDIDSLDGDFLIYRGCDVSEYESGRFGQSWTTRKEVAEKFAFDNYDSQEWFDINNRIIVQARYEKCNTLYSNQTEYGEYEIVIKTQVLTDVKIST